MHVEVDQSGKISDTKVPTVLAFSDGENYAILIPASVKRECIKFLRNRYRALRQPYMKLFAGALFLLLESSLPKITAMTLDAEYPGHEPEIRGMLLENVRHLQPDFAKERIIFRRIGKKSPAHKKAYAVFKGKDKPDRIISFRQMQSVLSK